jgi:serine/threonine protein kinase
VFEFGSEPISGFRLQARLAVGAFAEVWEARSVEGRAVALKFIDTRHGDAAQLRAEIHVLQAIAEKGHPNLIRLLGVYTCSHHLVLCLEKADGNLEDLRLRYRETSGRNIAPDHLLDMLGQAAQGLDCLARIRLPGSQDSVLPLQHCDVRPSNLLIAGDVLKITGFALCAATTQQAHALGRLGTMPYAAPELSYGQASAATDQYSLAVTYCDLVAGNRVMAAAADTVCGSYEINLAKVRGRERPVLERALAKDPLRRFPSCEAFINALCEVALPYRHNSRLNSRPGRPPLVQPARQV